MTGGRSRVEAVHQTAAVLRALGAERGELGLTELSERLGMRTSAVSRIAASMEEAGLLERGRRGGYRLGLPLWHLGARALEGRELWDEARGVTQTLVRETGLVGLIAVYDQGEAIHIEQVRSGGEVLGRAVPAHASALGKVLLAHLPLEELRRAISERGLAPLTERTITEAAALDRDLEGVRARGWALEDGEYEPGLRAVGAPVCDHAGQVLAAIGAGGAIEEVPEERIEEVAERVLAAAGELSRLLGAGERDALAPIALRVERRGGPRDPQAILTRERTAHVYRDSAAPQRVPAQDSAGPTPPDPVDGAATPRTTRGRAK